MFTRHRLAVTALGSCLALAAWSAAEATPSPEPGQPASDRLAAAPSPEPETAEPTALLVSATNRPLSVTGSDGLVHLDYDLVVTNVFVAPATITSVEAIGPDGSTLLHLEGDGLAHRSLRYALNGERILKAEMFAIDYVQLDDGFFFTGDGSSTADYPSFGSDVVAVADGEVTFVRDDMPEETPNQAPLNVKQPIDYAGNQVVLQIAPDVWAIYAHLRTGRVDVEVGDRVTTGQLLGQLGNTGNTTLPHLPFVLTDDPDFFAADSVPYVFDGYTLAGNVTPAALDAALSGPTPLPIAVTGPPQPQEATHPLYLSVSEFP